MGYRNRQSPLKTLFWKILDENDGRLWRIWLKGSLGDTLHTEFCGAVHNLRIILRALRLYFAFVLTGLWGIGVANRATIMSPGYFRRKYRCSELTI